MRRCSPTEPRLWPSTATSLSQTQWLQSAATHDTRVQNVLFTKGNRLGVVEKVVGEHLIVRLEEKDSAAFWDQVHSFEQVRRDDQLSLEGFVPVFEPKYPAGGKRNSGRWRAARGYEHRPGITVPQDEIDRSAVSHGPNVCRW